MVVEGDVGHERLTPLSCSFLEKTTEAKEGRRAW
jgi:hypothetical protein